MAYCVVCGSNNADDARFCINCGAELSADSGLSSEAPEQAAEQVSVVESEAGVVEAAPEEKTEAPKKRGRKKKEAEPVVSEVDAEEITQEPKTAEIFFDPAEEPEQAIEAAADEPVVDVIEELPETKEPERIDQYIPPAMPNKAPVLGDVYRPQYTDSPYADPIKIGTQQVPVQQPVLPIIEDKNAKPISTAAYFWLKVLFAIPGLGFLMSIILSFAPSNLCVKRYSRASMIFQLIVFVILLIGALVLIILDRRYGIFYNGSWGFHGPGPMWWY